MEYSPSPVIEYKHWINSQLSVARFYGGIKIQGKFYLIVDGDLVRNDWLQIYKKQGKAKTLSFIRRGLSAEQAKKEIAEEKILSKRRADSMQPDLFSGGDDIQDNK